jgi:hypothetical protein
VRAAAATAEREGLAVLTSPEAFVALASRAARLSGPAVFFSVLLIPSNRMAPDKIAIPGYPNMHLERGFDQVHWRFVYQDREGQQRTAGEKDGGFIATVEGQIVGRIDDKGNVVLSRPALDAVAGPMVAERGPGLCPAAKPDRPGQGATGEARDYENRVKRVVNPYRPTPNALSYYLHNPNAKVSVPAGIVTERTPDGGLLMIAAETRLDPQNAEHMKGSRAIAEIMIEHAGRR